MERPTKKLNLPSGKTAEIIENFNFGESMKIDEITLFSSDTSDVSEKQQSEFKMETSQMIDMLKLTKENKIKVRMKEIELAVKKIDGKEFNLKDIENLSVEDADFLSDEIAKIRGVKKK